MSISPISGSITAPVPVKKNDNDGDEINGVDPANEKAKEALKLAAKQEQSSAAVTSNPNLGKNFSQTA
jgi:hypothetical protein